AIRASLILSLALLGATPLVRCSRLSLARPTGASVALALVIDDSHSMRSRASDGSTRWKLAIEGARQLLASARDGDAVAIVLGGRPARLALAATSDLRAAAGALSELEPSDRATDIAGAMALARSSLKQLPQVDKRVVLFSDLAGEQIPEGTPRAWAPLATLRRSAPNCAVISAD